MPGFDAEGVEEVAGNPECVQELGPASRQDVRQEPFVDFAEGSDDVALGERRRCLLEHRRQFRQGRLQGFPEPLPAAPMRSR